MGGGVPNWHADGVTRIHMLFTERGKAARSMTVKLDESCMESLSRKLTFNATALDLAHLVEGFLSTFVNFDSEPPDTTAYRVGRMHGNCYGPSPAQSFRMTSRPVFEDIGDGRVRYNPTPPPKITP